MYFPISGVETEIWIPPLVAFGLSFFTSMGGVSGAFLLLPFQMSVLGFTSPAVSPTNLVFNIVAIPSGVYRYFREGRMVWPLAWIVILGTLPGIVGGGFIRILYLPDPAAFKIFVAFVLLYIGGRLVWDFLEEWRKARAARAQAAPADAQDWRAHLESFTLRQVALRFHGVVHRASVPGIFLLALAVGVVGGVYGIGGGAIIAPFYVAIFRLPVYAVAGAALLGTLVTSGVGVAFYQIVAPYFSRPDLAIAPDWLLGGLFGVGGMAGIYLGARCQRFVPARWIKLMLAVLLTFVAVRYLGGA
jgi:uncharacterized membrane protein YfcA